MQLSLMHLPVSCCFWHANTRAVTSSVAFYSCRPDSDSSRLQASCFLDASREGEEFSYYLASSQNMLSVFCCYIYADCTCADQWPAKEGKGTDRRGC